MAVLRVYEAVSGPWGSRKIPTITGVLFVGLKEVLKIGKQLPAHNVCAYYVVSRYKWHIRGDPHVPNGNWNDDQVKSNLNWADNTNDNVRPRLAVIARGQAPRLLRQPVAIRAVSCKLACIWKILVSLTRPSSK